MPDTDMLNIIKINIHTKVLNKMEVVISVVQTCTQSELRMLHKHGHHFKI